LNVVVIDPAHGGTDPGARGVGGIRESDIVLELASQVRRGLEAQGFQVLQTRTGNENPSFDDRSSLANAQTGAIFVTLHISSTGIASTVRVYTMPDMAPPQGNGGLIPWEQAQAAYLSLSRKLGDAIQGELAQKFKGSSANVQTAFVRQLRTTAAPAVAVEISNVTIPDKAEMDRMLSGVADSIVRGVVAFRPSYVTPSVPGIPPGVKL
jgi:N-acetylmuramoyl-L-alanine amidase